MPNINLRLTDEQHAQLERWAHDGYWSIQKEIIFRLFTSGSLSERGGSVESADDPPASRRDASRPRSESDPHFKPDFKKSGRGGPPAVTGSALPTSEAAGKGSSFSSSPRPVPRSDEVRTDFK